MLKLIQTLVVQCGWLGIGLALSSSGWSQEADKPAAEPAKSDAAPAVSLKVGDRAPGLTVDHWLKGEPVSEYSRDNIYVLEFWATWCGPCIKSMPHLNELAERYAKDGLVVVAVTKEDESNTREEVEKFIKEAGSKYAFRYAFSESDTMYRNFMEAAGQQGIPCSFVVDRDGQIAYIGLPADLDYVIDRLVKGQWRGQADADELREMNQSITKLGQLALTDPDKAHEIALHIRRVNPQRTKMIDFAYVEMMVLCKKKMFDEAKAVVEGFEEGSKASSDQGQLAMVSAILVSTELNPDGVHREFALKKIQQAEEALKDDWQNLVQVAIAYQMAGQKDNYKVCMERVIELCPEQQIKTALRTSLELMLRVPGK